MVDYSLIYKNLIESGYHVGTFDDFYNGDIGVTSDQLLNAANLFKSTVNDFDQVYVYRHNYLDQNVKGYLTLPNYSGPSPSEEELLQEVSVSRISHRKKFIDDVVAGGGHRVRTTQQWYRLNLNGYDQIDEKTSSNMYSMHSFFETLIKKFVKNIYSDLYQSLKYDQLKCATQLSIYKEGDFSDMHFDGINPGRSCVIILYFADPNNYDDHSGGKLRIQHDHVDITVDPIYGNYAMLDFSKWNISHSIEMVHGNFIRFALQSFVGIW